jgi:nucleotide-binding universal stress UspA family protein
VTLACGLAGYHGGEVVAFCVLRDRIQSEAGGERSPAVQAEERLALAVETAHRWEVPIHTEVVARRDVAEAILAKTGEMRAELLVMGWRGGMPRRVGFASEELDRVVEQAGCDVAILKPAPRVGAFRRILIADLRDANAVLAHRVGDALADQFGAELYRLELAKPGSDPAAAPAGVSLVRAEGGAAAERFPSMVADSTPEGILGAARGFDLVVVGTRQRLSQQLLYGTHLEAIARRASASILVVRARAG